MENGLNAALLITAIGMTLLFLALALFYGLMSALTAVIRDRVRGDFPQAEESERAEDPMLQAAAIAVALARAEVEGGFDGAGRSWREEEVSGCQVSSWWLLHHQRHMILSANRRRAV